MGTLSFCPDCDKEPIRSYYFLGTRADTFRTVITLTDYLMIYDKPLESSGGLLCFTFKCSPDELEWVGYNNLGYWQGRLRKAKVVVPVKYSETV